MKSLRLLFPLMLFACQESSSSGTGQIHPGSTAPTTTPTSTSTTPENGYTYLFPDFYKGGLLVGNTTNLLFALDFQQKSQTISPPPDFPGFQGTITPKIITRFELGSYCGFASNPTGVQTDIINGEKAWVETLEMTMGSTLDGSPPEDPIANEMCYGYRTNSAWVWKLEAQQATWNAATGKYVMTFHINAGPIDAIKVLFNNGFGAKRLLEKMVLVAKPAQ